MRSAIVLHALLGVAAAAPFADYFSPAASSPIATAKLIISELMGYQMFPPGPVHSAAPLSRLPPVTLPLENYFNGTDLQWYGNIQVGNPPQNFTVVFDTGGAGGFGVIPSVDCFDCKHQRRFDHRESSTFVDLNESQTIVFLTGGGVTPGTETVVVDTVRDTVRIGGIDTGNQNIFLVKNETVGLQYDPYDGVFALGFLRNDTIFAHLIDLGMRPVFSFLLTPKEQGHAHLILGGIDPHYEHGLTYIPVAPASHESHYWQLESSGIKVNGKTTKSLKKKTEFIIDTGNSGLGMPKELTEAIYALISDKIVPHGDLGAYGIPCSEISKLKAVLSFRFHTTSGKLFDIVVPSKELSVGPFRDDPHTCQTLINALDGLYVLGGSMLKHYYSVWDLEHSRIGFVENV